MLFVIISPTMARSENGQTHPYEAWKAAVGDSLGLQDPHKLPKLFAAIQAGELSIQTRNGEKVRYGKIVSIDVFYQATDGRTYMLEEDRYSLKPQRTLEEGLNDPDARIPSPSRPAPNSMSERLKIVGEEPIDGAIRGLHEEVFETAIEASGREYPELDALLREQLVEQVSRELVTGSDEPGNSFKGLKSIYDETIYSITFTPDMDLPFTLDADGKPQRLYEYVEEGEDRYLNFFEWHAVPKEKLEN
jgi:hypothetical protein